MTSQKTTTASLRLTAAIMGAAFALSFPFSIQTATAAEDPQDTIAALKAALAARDAEIATLKAASASKPAPAATAPATATTTTAAAPAGEQPAAKDDSITQMSAFEVRTTQGQGYSAGNSASALKTSEPLMKLPAQIIVLTSDMIDDIGSHNASDVLAYAGLVAYYRGPAILSRGSRIGNPYIDDVPQAAGIGISDNTNIDTYQVIKGPEQVLYPLASLGGLVLETTKKPLPDVTQGSIDVKVLQWGRQTDTFDFNQPLWTVGTAKITARVEGIFQQGQGPFYNSKDDRYGIFPNLAFDWRDTHIVVQYGAEIFHYLPGGTGILTPDGGVYAGLGERQQNSPPNNDDKNEQHDARISWTQRISDEWQVKSQATYYNTRRYGSTAFPTTVNWNNDTVTYTVRRNNGWQAALDAQTDVSGRYNVGWMPMTTAFGGNLHDQTGFSAFWLGTPVTIAIGDANAINSFVLPSVYGYTPPANPGSRVKTYVSNGYFMQSADVIPKWLTLSAGLTFSEIETITDTNLALRNPFTSTDSAANELLHRLAAVVYLNKDLTAYVSESTTFNPSVGPQFDNSPLPSVLGKSDEVGLKSSFLDGKLSASIGIYKMTLSNQAILAAFPALNVANLNYYIPIGTTVSKGWDASFALAPLPGLQVVGTAYIGTVKDQNGNPVTGTVENSWSLFTRYDFSRDTPLKGFAVGGGAQRAGGKWFSMSGMVLPGGAALPVNSSGNSVFKLKQDVLLNLFTQYEINHHWLVRVNCDNVLDKSYPIGAQGVGLVDAIPPRTFSFETKYKY